MFSFSFNYYKVLCLTKMQHFSFAFSLTNTAFIISLNLGRSNWESYVPHTNVLWLNYLLVKISQSGKLKDISKRTWRAKFRPYLKEILQFSSAQEAFMKLFQSES